MQQETHNNHDRHLECRSKICNIMAANKDVWFIDDNPLHRLLTTSIFKGTDHQNRILVFDGAEAALIALKSAAPKVIFIDVYLQGISGLEFAQMVRKKGYNGKMFALSSTFDPSHINKLADLDVPFISKAENYDLITKIISENK